MTDYRDDWYRRGLEAAWDRPAFKEAVITLLTEMSEDYYDVQDTIEDAAFGVRVECPHLVGGVSCGSANLPGAPRCWGCERELTWPTPTK